MIRKIARFIILFIDWNIDRNPPKDAEGSVLVMAPHTSNWDFILGRLAFFSYGVDVKLLVKKESFVFPFGFLLKAIGGIPVDRKKNNNLTDYVAKLYAENPKLMIIFTPEGTRSHNGNWKKGFYYIAKRANVKIYLCYVNFKNKSGGFGEVFEHTDDSKHDLNEIKKYYLQYEGKDKENGVLPSDVY
jgi:1-acyl-sn-glycerol-3-phosphate acyltransferase